ncbi:hypothetical protein, conserved [Cyanidioschyzon merolae strain 10D]|jgi:division protein CdvB (Snf7/Vps24/ESCRT-III family)|uniref:Uncharacterized protein n=1 Tax=Cyanidioschyzon merolae (strain NIES-3377 / 10D) TaxID=280699 RepID=M1VKW5_CYAM1|nr:hypothetical protein, conserved [Cyanidioschyzon merolae strain 10D]BAM82228.1 hypothetical protein, conserved [Cyanidioschyzon merolae strain 10D]|eukprot:XP_005538264.1 hypothetical protein, conserved [Cyanidioschyzon merolae strain 10D]
MGLAQSSSKRYQEHIFKLLLLEKHLRRQANRCQRERERYVEQLKAALKSGNAEMSVVSAESAVRKARERTTYLRLAARLDAVVGRLKAARDLGQIGSEMGLLASDMDSAIRVLDVERLESSLQLLENRLDDVQVRDVLINSGLDRVSAGVASQTPEEDEVALLIRQTAEENNLELSHALGTAPTLPLLQRDLAQAQERKRLQQEQADLSARLRALQLP